MIGHQQAATGINALKSTLQEGEEAVPPVMQENGKEMEEVSEQPPPKVNNPAAALEGGDTASSTAVNNTALNVEATENGTNNGDASNVEKPDNEEKEEEGEDPIDMTFPAKDGWKAILVYIISFPIMGPLFITLPDTKNEKSQYLNTNTIPLHFVSIFLYNYRKEILLHYLYWKHIVDRGLFLPDGMVGYSHWQML